MLFRVMLLCSNLFWLGGQEGLPAISSRNELPQARGMVNGEKATSALDALMHFDHRSCKPEMPERLHKMNEPQKTSH